MKTAESRDYQEDSLAPWRRRVCLPRFAGLDPFSYPWKELRRRPEDFPDFHVAKVSRVRTVIGFVYRSESHHPTRIYLKRSILRDPVKKLLARFRPTKEWREFLIARQFEEAGFLVPHPIYYAEGSDPEGHRVVFYATRALSDPWISLRDYLVDVSAQTGVWRSLAVYTKRMHDAEVFHADYRSDHIFLNPASLEAGREPAWATIDLDGSVVGSSVTSRQRAGALDQLAESLFDARLTVDSLAEFIRLYDPDGSHGLDAKRTIGAIRRRLQLREAHRRESGQ